MAITLLVLAISMLLILIAAFRLSAFLALTIVAIAIGLIKGMKVDVLVKSITTGIGSTLGGLVLVLGFGVMLGSLLAETGAARQISDSMVRLVGPKRAKWAMAITGFAVGLAMFYNAGFVVLIPLVFMVAENTGLPLVYLGTAMAAPLSVTHGFLPPHPGPTAIVQIVKADMGKTLVYGMIVALPAVLCAGIIFPEFLKKIVANPPAGLLGKSSPNTSLSLPPFFTSFMVAICPVILMAAATIAELSLPTDSLMLSTLRFFGDPAISMLIAVLLGLIFLGLRNTGFQNYKTRMDELMQSSSQALGAATMILLIIAAGGAFKQVLMDSGIGKEIAEIATSVPLDPRCRGCGTSGPQV